jgi:hypothetical protein
MDRLAVIRYNFTMSIFFLKSILSLLLMVLTFVLMFTIFEVLGRSQKRFNIERFRSLHKISGYVYLIVFSVITYYCIDFIVSTKTELSSRATLHAFLAVTILALFGLKLSFIRTYRRFYDQVRNIGMAIGILTFGLVGSSAGYHLFVSEFGTYDLHELQAMSKNDILSRKEQGSRGIVIKNDAESIGRGKNLFDSKCIFCHYAYNTGTKVGPGLKGILKKSRLPVSKNPAVPENVIKQLRHPFDRMPSFDYLTNEQIADLLAFLNTL